MEKRYRLAIFKTVPRREKPKIIKTLRERVNVILIRNERGEIEVIPIGDCEPCGNVIEERVITFGLIGSFPYKIKEVICET